MKKRTLGRSNLEVPAAVRRGPRRDQGAGGPLSRAPGGARRPLSRGSTEPGDTKG